MEVIRRGNIEPFSIEGPDAGTCSHYCGMYSYCGTQCLIDIF